ncbi:heparinase II/III domain-containing protein [Microbacterium indicum]|uniref:heparinase II/III domain-containing protein n=1 Tax=Microbacterium indicum TaxID=358100 RepID=UPI00040E130A|nr:heparinase II/III family protein [Microbacterium indicum]
MSEQTPDLRSFDLAAVAAGVPYRPIPRAGDDLWAQRDGASADGVVAAAAEAALEATPALTREQWAAFVDDGTRTTFETPYFERRRRVTLFALAAALRPDDAGLRASLKVELGAILAEDSWCLPAHYRLPDGELMPEPDPRVPVLDLFAAETAGTLAWIASVHGDDGRIVREIERRVLEPFERDGRRYGWFGQAANWNPWIVSNVLTALLLTEPEDATRIPARLDLAAESLQSYADGVPRDGGSQEGVMYWWQSGARFFEAIELLGLGDPDSAVRAFLAPLLGATASYPLAVALGDGRWNATFADGKARITAGAGFVHDHVSPELLHRFATLTAQPEVAEYARAMRGSGPATPTPLPLGRAVRSLFDDAWNALDPRPGAVTFSARWLPDTGVFSATNDGVRVVAKGGHNGEPHNHLDVGTFVVAVAGEPVVVDIGAGQYTAASFSERRYEQWFTRSEFHGVPIVAGEQQGVGAEFAAADERGNTGDSWRFSLDIAGAYPAGAVATWVRTIEPVPGGIAVTDAWAGADAELVLMLPREPVRRDDGSLGLVGVDSGEVRAALATGAEASWERIPTDDPSLAAAWGEAVFRLRLAPPVPGNRIEIRAI